MKLLLGQRIKIESQSVTLKVNGVDLSSASHEQTIKVFNSAQEPIIVEVLRRTQSSHAQNSTSAPTYTTSSTQTDSMLSDSCCRHLFTLPSPPPLSQSFEDLVDLSTNALAEDIQYEDVLLRRDKIQDRIGLTLIYGETEESGITDIFIGEVEPQSIAALNGRIKEGDQILQINNEDVHNRDEAIHLLSQSSSEIQLLLCRPSVPSQLDDGFVEEADSEDDLNFSISKYLHERQFKMGMPLIEEENCDGDDSTVTNTATLPSSKEKEGKDSGVGHEENSEQECECTSYQSQPNSNSEPKEMSVQDQCAMFREILESKCLDLQALSEQLNQIPLEGGHAHRAVPKMGTKIFHEGRPSVSEDISPDTAYNTAESSKSHSPTTLRLSVNEFGSTVSLAAPSQKSSSCRTSEERRHKSKRSSEKKSAVDSSPDLTIAYTTEDQLYDTIARQQKMLLKQASSSALNQQSSAPSNPRIDNSSSQEMEWIVKRRSDGSRYITRRPSRSKILSERKKRVENERCGLTTDDDAVSELKVGRYWSRDDRRKHLQKARDYQQKKQCMKQKLQALKNSPKPVDIVKMGQTKLNKHALKDLDFTTVPELMAHGFKYPHSKSNLFSVTTV